MGVSRLAEKDQPTKNPGDGRLERSQGWIAPADSHKVSWRGVRQGDDGGKLFLLSVGHLDCLGHLLCSRLANRDDHGRTEHLELTHQVPEARGDLTWPRRSVRRGSGHRGMTFHRVGHIEHIFEVPIAWMLESIERASQEQAGRAGPSPSVRPTSIPGCFPNEHQPCVMSPRDPMRELAPWVQRRTRTAGMNIVLYQMEEPWRTRRAGPGRARVAHRGVKTRGEPRTAAREDRTLGGV